MANGGVTIAACQSSLPVESEPTRRLACGISARLAVSSLLHAKLISDRYTSRNGTARPCEYTEDEAIHQQRFWEGKRRAGKPVMDPSLDPPETAKRARSRSSSTEVPSQPNVASQVSIATLVGNTDQDDDDDSSDSSDSDSSSLAPAKRGRVVSAASATSPGAAKKTISVSGILLQQLIRDSLRRGQNRL